MHPLAIVYSVSSLSSELLKFTPTYSLLLVVFLPIVLFSVSQYIKHNLYSVEARTGTSYLFSFFDWSST